jgi:hypothetical protein
MASNDASPENLGSFPKRRLLYHSQSAVERAQSRLYQQDVFVRSGSIPLLGLLRDASKVLRDLYSLTRYHHTEISLLRRTHAESPRKTRKKTRVALTRCTAFPGKAAEALRFLPRRRTVQAEIGEICLCANKNPGKDFQHCIFDLVAIVSKPAQEKV